MVRAWLEAAGRGIASSARNGGGGSPGHIADSLEPPRPGGKPGTPERHARTPSKSSGQAAVPSGKSAGNRPVPSSCQFTRRSSFGRPSGPRWGEQWESPAYRPAKAKAPGSDAERAFSAGPDSPATVRLALGGLTAVSVEPLGAVARRGPVGCAATSRSATQG